MHPINFERIPYAMRVESGATLVFSNVQLLNLAPSSAYSYSSSNPWRSTGQGAITWPSIGLAVNATVRRSYITDGTLLLQPSIMYSTGLMLCMHPWHEGSCITQCH
jgi:hypothetical protein